MREIGSFIELELEKGKEYYNEAFQGENNIIRLNTGRAGIYHAVRCFDVKKVYLPVYECDSVREFLINNNIEVKYYRIDKNFKPVIETNEKDFAIVFSNYYGIMSRKHFDSFINNFNNVIIDNAQAFFFKPIENCMNVYSCRKFIGVPDGCYVIGNNVNRFEYEKDYSSDTAKFLLERIEYGCEGKAYEDRKENEKRIDTFEVKSMSDLTRKILDGSNYYKNIETRNDNFKYARELFDSINLINLDSFVDNDTVPMVYPLLIEKDLIDILKQSKVFQGHWWEYLVNETSEDMFENKLSKYIIPITIDQRYTKEDIDYQYKLIKENL